MHAGDLARDDLDGLLDGVDAVVHLAGEPGRPGVLGTSFATYVERNIIATQRLLEAATAADVRRFVYASSSSVYGPEQRPLVESAVPRPLSPYGASKLAGEVLVGAYAQERGLSTVVPAVLLGLRPAAAAGHGGPPVHRGAARPPAVPAPRRRTAGARLHLRRGRRRGDIRRAHRPGARRIGAQHRAGRAGRGPRADRDPGGRARRRAAHRAPPSPGRRHPAHGGLRGRRPASCSAGEPPYGPAQRTAAADRVAPGRPRLDGGAGPGRGAAPVGDRPRRSPSEPPSTSRSVPGSAAPGPGTTGRDRRPRAAAAHLLAGRARPRAPAAHDAPRRRVPAPAAREPAR